MNWQKIIILDVNAQTQATIQGYLNLGYVLHQMTVITVGTVQKIIIVYYEPEENPPQN